MSRSGGDQSTSQSASDADFRATFSLLPHVNNIMRTLAGGQGDPKVVQKTVDELQFQLHRCQQLLDSCPYLDLSTREQRTLLDNKRQLLQQKSNLLLTYKDLAVLGPR